MSTRVIEIVSISGDSENRLFVTKNCGQSGRGHQVMFRPICDVIPHVGCFYAIENIAENNHGLGGEGGAIRILRRVLAPEVPKAGKQATL